MANIEVKLGLRYALVHCSAPLIDEIVAIECLEALSRENHERPLLVFDFLAAESIWPSATRVLARAFGFSQKSGVSVRMVTRPEVAKEIKERGLDRILQCVPSVEGAIEQEKKAPRAEEINEFLNTVLEAIAHTLRVMTKTEVTAGTLYMRGTAPDPVKIDIAATIGIVSIPFSGSLVLAFPEESYRKMMSRMFDQDLQPEALEIKDGVAELLNIVLGQTKIPLNKKGYEIQQGIPTVVHGKGVSIFPSSLKPSIIVPFSSDMGSFYIEMSANRNPLTG